MTGNANEELTILGPNGLVIDVAPLAAVDQGDGRRQGPRTLKLRRSAQPSSGRAAALDDITIGPGARSGSPRRQQGREPFMRPMRYTFGSLLE